MSLAKSLSSSVSSAVAFSFAIWAGSAFAGDFSSTLHYPEAPATMRPATGVDHATTGSILKKLVTGKPDASARPKAKKVPIDK